MISTYYATVQILLEQIGEIGVVGWCVRIVFLHYLNFDLDEFNQLLVDKCDLEILIFRLAGTHLPPPLRG